MSEARDTRLKRLRMRSWRRGTKEMDLILGGFADASLDGLEEGALDDYDALLNENDQDLYLWVNGRGEPPARLVPLLGRIADHVEAAAQAPRP